MKRKEREWKEGRCIEERMTKEETRKTTNKVKKERTV